MDLTHAKTIEDFKKIIDICSKRIKELQKPKYILGNSYSNYKLVQMCTGSHSGYGLMASDFRIYDYAETLEELVEHNPNIMAI